MNTKSPYIVWTNCRQRKAIILVDHETNNPYADLILNASLKFGIIGTTLVLESNGTPVEEETLPFLKNEIFIILEKHEAWTPRDNSGAITIPIHSIQSASTLTVLSNDSSIDVEQVPFDSQIDSTELLVFKPKSSVSVDCNFENFWRNFEIPFQKLSREQLSLLEKGVVERYTTTTLIQLIVSDMRCFKKSIPSKAFRIIAKKIVDAYPEAFLDKDRDGIVLGDGTHKLVSKLIDHNNYLNRPKGEKRKSHSENPISNKKQHVSAKAGCSNWNPIITNTETLSESEKKMRESNENFMQTLENSYAEMREYINKVPPPSVGDILEEWPLIFSKKSIKWHFTKLTNSDINLLDKVEYDLGIINKVCQKTAEEDEVEPNIKALSVLEKIARYFKEDISELVWTKKIDDADNVENLMPITPIIIFDEQEETPQYFVHFEKTRVDVSGFDTFVEAFKVAFALYFVLNLKYPSKMCSTLEFIQRFYLKIHPDAGSKVAKKVTASKKKVMNLMLKFNKHITI